MKLKKAGKLKDKPAETINETSSTSDTPLDRLERERQRIRNASVADQYQDRVSKKLGARGKLLGNMGDEYLSSASKSDTASNEASVEDIPTKDDMDDEEIEMLEAVERALKKKREREAKEEKTTIVIVDEMELLAEKMEKDLKEAVISGQEDNVEIVEAKKTTSGIGGAWSKNETSKADSYRPANGGWGYFPRPKDISKAYGGGKRVGAEVETTMEDEMRKQQAIEDTRDKLKIYREKVGIEVQSEKEHAKEIEEALLLGQRAMQRGVYGTAVSVLEKVTKWCSTNSKVGSQVFLELAMAYEAVGRTSEAIQVYTALTTSRMDDVKYNAKKLLYGIEAMQFMRDEAKSEAFSKKKASQTFIDTTGLGNIASNFDKVYNTAYVDLDRKGGYYRKLTQNVVRSAREARQILLAATDSSEVDRTKIVQALLSIDRSFQDALRSKIKREKLAEEKPVAMMNGVPIQRKEIEEDLKSYELGDNLGEIDQVMENIGGIWRLQLLASNKGDGVDFFNKTLSSQSFDTSEMNYKATSPSGFFSLSQKGVFEIDEKQRIITRRDIEKEGSAAFFTDVYSTKLSGPIAAVNLQQQIISIDSELLVTRTVVPKEQMSGNIKGYFSVWRRTNLSVQ